MIGVIIGGNCEKTIEMCIKSLKDCKKIYFIHGGSEDKTLEIVNRYDVEILNCLFNINEPLMPSIQKNFMLDVLKKKHLGEWCIYLDADEVLADNYIAYFNKEISKEGLYEDVECFDIRMIHFIENLCQDDNTQPAHRTPTRIFKITSELYYPKSEHCILSGMKYDNIGFLIEPGLFHLAYCGGIFDIKRRYDGQMKRHVEGQSHNKEFLKQWLRAHLFGVYPKRPVDPMIIPRTIFEYFDIDKDEIYFNQRGIEAKHFIMTKQWIDVFKPDYVLEFGCGKAPYGYAFNSYGIKYIGYELSKFAVDNAFAPILQGNIISTKTEGADLVIAFDVLEHLEYDDLDAAINNLIDNTKKFILISVPVKGDPNLYNDPTHVIREHKDWWIKQFTDKDLKLIKTPDHFLYKEQIMVFEK